jgi:hypothetical protein
MPCKSVVSGPGEPILKPGRGRFTFLYKSWKATHHERISHHNFGLDDVRMYCALHKCAMLRFQPPCLNDGQWRLYHYIYSRLLNNPSAGNNHPSGLDSAHFWPASALESGPEGYLFPAEGLLSNLENTGPGVLKPGVVMRNAFMMP